MTTSPSANWNYPTAVRFGAGRISELPQLCKDHGFKRPLLVTDPFLATQKMTHQVLDDLKSSGLAAGMFSDIRDRKSVV